MAENDGCRSGVHSSLTKNSLENFESCSPRDFGFRDSRSGFGVTLAVQDAGEGVVMGVDCSSVVQNDKVDVGCWFSCSGELHALGTDGACSDQETMMSSNRRAGFHVKSGLRDSTEHKRRHGGTTW